MATAQIGLQMRPRAPIGLIVLALGLALFFGLVSVFLPIWFVVSVLMVPTVATLVFVRPEIAIVAMIAFTCGLIHPALIPRVPVFGGTAAAADAALAMLILYAAFLFLARAGRVKSVPVAGARWLGWPLALFGVCYVIAVTGSLWFRDLNQTWVLSESRHFLYLLALPIAVIVLRDPVRQRRFVIGLVVLGCLFSIGQVLQGVFNVPVFGIASRLVVLETLGQREYGTTRSLTLGIGVIVLALLLVVGAYVLGTIRKPLFFPVALLLLAGIFLSFGRTTFVITALTVLLVVWWLNLRKLPQLLGWFVLLAAAAAFVGSLWKPEALAAAYYRITSIGTEIQTGDSAQWRYWEAEAMWPHIQKYPLIGLGIGADYKGRGGAAGHPELNRYVHNTYLFVSGKLGLPALAFLLTAFGAIFFIGRRSALHGSAASTRVVGAACAASMLGFLVAGLTEPHFHSDYSLVVIAIGGALVYLNARNPHTSAAAAKAAAGPRPFAAAQVRS